MDFLQYCKYWLITAMMTKLLNTSISSNHFWPQNKVTVQIYLWTVTAHIENTKKKGLFETITKKKFGCEILILVYLVSDSTFTVCLHITMSDHNIKHLGDYYSVQAIFFFFFHFQWLSFLVICFEIFRCTLWMGTFFCQNYVIC